MGKRTTTASTETHVGEPRITIVVLSYERQDFLRRQLLYYANRHVHLIFADGSANAWPHEHFGSNDQMSWEYLHCPGYDTYRERLALACERLTTEYVCLLDDQECILWTGLVSAISTLDENPDHSCAGGLAAITFEAKKQLMLAPWGHRGVRWSLTDPSPLARFRTIVGPEQFSANLYYQVVRSTDMKLFAEGMRGFSGVSSATNELALAGFLSLKGIWAMGDYPYWLRSGSTVPPPSGVMVVMPSEEIRLLCSRLIELTDSTNETAGNSTLEAGSLALELEAGWGETSQWAQDSVAYLEGIRGVHKRSDVTRRLRASIAIMLREHAPTVYRFLRPGSPLDMRLARSFLDYGSENSECSYEVIEDLLTISAIWHKFPNGIPADYWGKVAGTKTEDADPKKLA